MTPDANDLCVFAVKRGYIESKEIYCNPLYPTYLSLVEKYQHSPYANGILNNHVAVNPKTDCSLLSDSSEVSFVPMANVQEKTNVVSYDMVAYETVKKGFTVFQRGDLIWAKITPCMQNGKSCIVDKMPTEIGFGSTEFHVIRKRNENVYMPFIWAILSSDDVLKAAQATFSGSAGQQRVSASFIENFPAVLPDYPVQVRLVAELEDKLNLLNGKLQRAYELLHKTPMYLIDRLGLTFDFSATQKITYATTVANIEGRIDADYYSPKFSHFRSQIEALPYRTVSVDDISEKIVSGFAAGKQDQADNLPEDQRVPHLRPFSITPEGELSFETKKYVPKSRLKSEDYCKKNEVIFNNTNSPDLVGKTTVFDSDVLCAASNHMSDSSFSHDNVEFDEIAPNVIKAKATDVLNDYLSFVVENVPVEDVKSAYDFLTIVPGQLKTICDTTHPILPIWEREKRNHCFAVRPIYMSNNDYIYSPIIMEEVRKRWIEGFLQFYPPFEIGLERTCTALYAWKNNYEHLFSSEVEVLLKESGCEYAKHDVDLRREDRRGNHPTIDVLGDYDVIGLNTTQKRIFIIECKVLQPIGSVFEHSNQQKRFFTKEKFDEKFQKRIDYFSKVAMSFFANHGYDTEGFTINPYMVVNKVFSSYYKHVQFPIVTFDELKREIQL